jgi:hypothetical protein
MPPESLTYVQIAERLGTTAEAARALVRRHHLPRSTANDGKSVVLVDMAEIVYRKPARKPGGAQVEELLARIAVLEAELAAANERAGGFRADYERERDRGDRERDRGDRLMAMHDTLVAELEALRKAMEVQAEATRNPGGDHLDMEPPRHWAVRAWRWMQATA